MHCILVNQRAAARGLCTCTSHPQHTLKTLVTPSQPRPFLSHIHTVQGYLDVGSVQSDDTLQHTGDLVIHGSVARGATIIASGDVICLGSVQGSIHAGADLGSGPNEVARIVALEMRGARLKIAGIKTLGDAKVITMNASVVAKPAQTSMLLGGSCSTCSMVVSLPSSKSLAVNTQGLLNSCHWFPFSFHEPHGVI